MKRLDLVQLAFIIAGICSAFFCVPLKKVEKGEMSFEKAQKLIETAYLLRNEILEIARTIEEFKDFSMRQLIKEIEPTPSDLIKNHRLLWTKIIAIKVALLSFKKIKK